MNDGDAKDGFDLIEYPVDYRFKAVCNQETGTSNVEYLSDLLIPLIAKDALLSTHTKSSRNGKFESVTLTIHLHNRDELELVYKCLADSPRVVMTL